ncbi:MAG: Thioredoxin peroxidase 1 [Pseudomonadota bacterium]|jgi:peroxiredoxin (alkyl hydroperoxide reductase subunit C)
MKAFVGKEAPNFHAKAVMPDNEIEFDFSLQEYLDGSKGVVFFYPLDFTFVCPSEIIAFHNRLGEFAAHNAKVVAISVDSHFSHLAWKQLPHNRGGIGNVQFPIVSDLNKVISNSYNVLNDDGIAMRGTFIIDQDFILRHMHINDLPLGRNVDEIIRILSAMEHHREYGEVCPAGWSKGKEAITASSDGIADYLASNAEKL